MCIWSPANMWRQILHLLFLFITDQIEIEYIKKGLSFKEENLMHLWYIQYLFKFGWNAINLFK